MKKRKFFGILVVIFGLIMVGDSLTYQGSYKAIAPIAMSLIVVAGLLMIFWDQVKSLLAKK